MAVPRGAGNTNTPDASLRQHETKPIGYGQMLSESRHRRARTPKSAGYVVGYGADRVGRGAAPRRYATEEAYGVQLRAPRRNVTRKLSTSF